MAEKVVLDSDMLPGDSPQDSGNQEESGEHFDPARLHTLIIEMSDADFESLRQQDRSYYDLLGEGCMEAPWESPYTYFPAQVRYDGEELGEVGVRKKGLIGSLSYDRPSLKIDVDQYVDDQYFHGLEKLVFNNNNQDPGRLRTCTAHAFFADTGLVAPRCVMTQVTVNGEDLGFYSHVESIDADLVARFYGEKPKAMYEGTLSDFREGWLATFESETDDSTGEELTALAEALLAEDAELLDQLGEVLDVEAFLTFWAAESMAGHWDGYNGNTNNFFVYTSPTDGRLRFIASGPDAAFDSRLPFGQNQPVWVGMKSALANRLIQHEQGRALYEAELARLVSEVWEEEARLAQFDALATLVEAGADRTMQKGIEETRHVLETRQGDLESTLGEEIEVPALGEDYCWSDHGSVEVDFSALWGSYPNGDLFGGGEVTASYLLDEVAYPTLQDGVSMGVYDGEYSIWLTISTIAEEVYLAPYVLVATDKLISGASLALDGHDAEAALLYMDPTTNGQWVTIAYLGEGELLLEEADIQNGGGIIGRLSARVLGGN